MFDTDNTEKIPVILKWLTTEGTEKVWGKHGFIVSQLYGMASAALKDDPDMLAVNKLKIESQIASLQANLETINSKIKVGGLNEVDPT